MIDILSKIKNKILTKDDYEIIVDSYQHFDISDKVVCFYNGRIWTIIKLDNMLAYPILYFDYWSSSDQITYENTLLICPITMRAMIYKGKIIINDIDKDRLILKNSESNEEYYMDAPYTYKVDGENETKGRSHVKRHEVKLVTLRDTFIFLTDPVYIIPKHHKELVLSKEYYENRFTYDALPIYTAYHPKTIVYMVQYYSDAIKGYKYTVILGKDINKDKLTGFSYKQSGIWEYLNIYRERFAEKKAFIYPIFWFMVDKLYEDVKIVLIK